ncbi:MAG: metallophosphoesterase [bacterium]
MIQRKKTLTLLLMCIIGCMLMSTLLGISGCMEETEDGTEYGDIVIGLTDNEGDFARYMVTVDSLTLTKANGEVVETLALATEVDFAEYAEMTEFLTAATIPSGIYTKAIMTLDYSNADIQVYDNTGNAVEVTSIQDTDGSAITTYDISVNLQGMGSVLIAPLIPSHLTLDFDLNASNSVENNGDGTYTLTVKPVLQAEINVDGSKPHRLRGPLKQVDTSNNTFKVIIRPFIHLLSGGDENFGVMTVTVDSETVFDINESKSSGSVGLAELASVDTLTGIIVKGQLTINPSPACFMAKEVYAGTSVPGGTLDVVTGNVVNRSSTELTVKGATLIRAGGSIVFNDEVTIQISENTRVSRQLSLSTEYDISDISVGQRVMIFGELTDDTATQLVLDATTEGHIHLLITTLRGTVVDDATSSWFVVNLDYIDGRGVSAFTFDTADPTKFEIDPGTLDISSLTVDTPVKVRGFVIASTDAPPDFEAQTIVDLTAIDALMTVGWGLTGSPDAITIEESGESFTINLNLTGIGLFHHIARGGIVKDLVNLSPPPSITSRGEGNGLFSINQSGTVQLFLTYEGFVENLQERLANEPAVKFIVAIGIFDDDAVSLSAHRVDIQIN